MDPKTEMELIKHSGIMFYEYKMANTGKPEIAIINFR